MIGQSVAHYRVTAKLGEGGMGEVYRASDTKLGRDVALKLLPEAVATDPERMARFEREAQLLAVLNHPNIAAIYGLEEAAGARCLVLELVEGETLADRITRGRLPLEEALPIARQVAEALGAAHEKGIVHRDLKPGNIKITPDGTVKVLDFGLAKALASDVTEQDISKSPTLTMAGATQHGVILGTAAYMSPEQARGRGVDKRADIWAFGCVLYEMLTGQQAYGGETISDTLAGILKSEVDWKALPAEVPHDIRRLLCRCLEKEPKRRLRDVGEAWLVLDDVLSGAASAEAVPAPAIPRSSPPWQRVLPRGVAGVLVLVSLVLAWGWWRAGSPTQAPVVRFSIPFPSEHPLASDEQPPLAISPDGSRIAYVATEAETAHLYLRSLDRLEATALPGTEGALNPFFSPDGQWIGFFSDGKLKKVQVSGGAALTLADASGTPRGASWGPGNMVVFAPTTTGGLKEVSGDGGPVREVSHLDAAQQERTHRWPQVLPGGKHALFTVGTLDSPEYYDDSKIDVVSLDTGERQTVLQGASMARYVSTGHLIYARSGSLWAVPFDLQQLRVSGSPVPVVEGVVTFTASGGVYFSLAENGTLIYVPGTPSSSQNQLAWTDRTGNVQVLPLQAGSYSEPRLSPDGRRVAVVVGGGKTNDIWVYDTVRNTFSRLTFEGNNRGPAWSPDGKSIIYWSGPRSEDSGLYVKPADGSGEARLLLPSTQQVLANDWSPDGKFLAIDHITSKTQSDIRVLSIGDGKEASFVETKFDEYEAAFSPDGRWVAYMSEESGRSEIYVKPFPGPGGKWQVSTSGGNEPLWSADGRELFFNNGDKMMAVGVDNSSGFKAETPQVLFSGFYNPHIGDQTYGVAPDGQRFLVIHPLRAASGNPQINVVLNWFEEMKRLAPGKN